VGWGSDQGREVEGVLHSSTPCWPVAMGSNTSYPDFDSAQFPSTLPYLPRICMCPSGGDIESPVNFSPCSVWGPPKQRTSGSFLSHLISIWIWLGQSSSVPSFLYFKLSSCFLKETFSPLKQPSHLSVFGFQHPLFDIHLLWMVSMYISVDFKILTK
jgi:hypothetical protein